jgi:hypothetical protein
MFTIIGGDGKEYGPVTADQIRTWIAAGRANLDTQAKAQGSEEWRRLGDYPDFSTAPVPPVMGATPGIAGPVDSSVAAGRGGRIGAALMNAFFYVLCTIPGSMLMSRRLLQQYPEIARGEMPRFDELDFAPLLESQKWVWAGLLAGILLQAILLAVRGQNLGKMIVGHKVVRASDGQSAGFARTVLLRYLLPVMVIIGFNSVTGVLGFLFLLIDFCFIFREDGRCLHDLMAGTKVVKVQPSPR